MIARSFAAKMLQSWAVVTVRLTAMSKRTEPSNSRFFNDDELSEGEFQVQQKLAIKLPELKSDHARRHLSEGLGRRLYMMESSRGFIREKLGPNRRQMLERYLAIEVNVHVNSFYSNLAGSLDNLAWTLFYEFQLQRNPDEDTNEHRRYCGLFKTQFLTDLEAHKPELVAKLEKYVDWRRNVSKFRDPGAHRIPLYVPPGIVDPKDQERFSQLYSKAFTHAAANRGRMDWSLMAEADDLAKFQDVMVLSGTEELRTFHFTAQLAQDYETLLWLSERVVDSL